MAQLVSRIFESVLANFQIVVGINWKERDSYGVEFFVREVNVKNSVPFEGIVFKKNVRFKRIKFINLMSVFKKLNKNLSSPYKRNVDYNEFITW